jgi:hypothetical protein
VVVRGRDWEALAAYWNRWRQSDAGLKLLLYQLADSVVWRRDPAVSLLCLFVRL